MNVPATWRLPGETTVGFANRLRRQYGELAKAVGYGVDEHGDVYVEHMAILRAAEYAHPARRAADRQEAIADSLEDGER